VVTSQGHNFVPCERIGSDTALSAFLSLRSQSMESVDLQPDLASWAFTTLSSPVSERPEDYRHLSIARLHKDPTDGYQQVKCKELCTILRRQLGCHEDLDGCKRGKMGIRGAKDKMKEMDDARSLVPTLEAEC
jgi:hypothetical protein